MGGFDHREDVTANVSDAGAPVLRITGIAVMGGVEVRVRYAGETGGETKRRLRQERKQKGLRNSGSEEEL